MEGKKLYTVWTLRRKLSLLRLRPSVQIQFLSVCKPDEHFIILSQKWYLPEEKLLFSSVLQWNQNRADEIKVFPSYLFFVTHCFREISIRITIDKEINMILTWWGEKIDLWNYWFCLHLFGFHVVTSPVQFHCQPFWKHVPRYRGWMQWRFSGTMWTKVTRWIFELSLLHFNQRTWMSLSWPISWTSSRLKSSSKTAAFLTVKRL